MHRALAALAALLSIGTGAPALAAPSAGAESRVLASLEAEAGRLEDAQQIRRLQRAYGYYLEKGFWREAADLFASDGTLEPGTDGVLAGPEQIFQYLKQRQGGGHDGMSHGLMNVHMHLQGVVDVAPDGRTAKARWRDFVMFGHYGADASWSDGPQEDTYVKQNGVWKIGSLRQFPTYAAPYEKGWAGGGPAAPFHYGPPAERRAQTLPSTSDPVLSAESRAITRLKARDEIENLQGIYGYYADASLWDEAAQLFARNATFEAGQRGVYRGRARIRQALELIGGGGPAPGKLNDGMQLQPLIHVSADGRSGKARWRGFFQLKSPDGPARWSEGTYENEYVLEDGAWKISRLHFYPTFEANYAGGWAKAAIPMEGPSKALPPDEPASEVYGSFPAGYVPPYHYTIGKGQDPAPPLPAARGRVAALKQRIERLQDHAEIENLQRQYGYYVDKHIWEALPELFTEDATLEIGGRGVFAGRARIHQYLQFLGGEGVTPGLLYNHSQLQPIVDVAPDGLTAKGRWTALIMVGIHGDYGQWGYATYENAYVKTRDGWRIKTLYAFFNFYADYDQGWGRNARPNTRPEAKLPPDRPPTVVYDTYPVPAMVPFHYRHPVTGKVTGQIRATSGPPGR